MKRCIQVLFILLLFSSCASKFGKVLKSKDNEYKYKMAEQYYSQKKWDKATQLFESLFPYVKGTARFEDMYYKYAYCAYNQKDYLNAENLFKNYTENFPNAQRTEECEYMRAYCFYKQSPKVDLDQTNTSKTVALMQAFINTHPGSERNKQAEDIIAKLREKQELKDFKAARLYYDLSYYKSAAVAFSTLMDDYPDSEKSDAYKLEVVRAYYKYAEMSVAEKQSERFEKVLTEISDFEDRFPQSTLRPQIEVFKTLSSNHIKTLQDEQAKATSGQ
jgi:outer membrane protein assembly factor BamD